MATKTSDKKSKVGSDENAFAKKKTECPITREQFRELAKGVTVKIGDSSVIAGPKEFSTGSLGWFVNGKVVLKVGDEDVTVQVGLNLTIVNSKELPE